MQVISVTFPKRIVVTVAVTAKHVVSADLTEILLDLDSINGEVIGTTAAEKTDKIEATKLAIETAIEAAYVDVPAGTVFADYPDYVAQARMEAYYGFSIATGTLRSINAIQQGNIVSIPAAIAGVNVRVIAAYINAYANVTGNSILELTMPDTIETIGNNCFQNNAIRKIIFSKNPLFKTIAAASFQGATPLKFANFPPNVTNIGLYAFNVANIATIKIGASVTIANSVSLPTLGVNGNAFVTLYSGNGLLAGIYTYTGGSWKLIQNIAASFTVANQYIDYSELAEIVLLLNSGTTANLTITGNPGAAAIMAAITAGTIVVPSGWTVIN